MLMSVVRSRLEVDWNEEDERFDLRKMRDGREKMIRLSDETLVDHSSPTKTCDRFPRIAIDIKGISVWLGIECMPSNRLEVGLESLSLSHHLLSLSLEQSDNQLYSPCPLQSKASTPASPSVIFEISFAQRA